MEIYKTLEITQNSPTSRVFNLRINRPSLRNALSLDFFTEFPKALTSLDQNPDASVIVLSGNGDHFCAGIDLKALSSMSAAEVDLGITADLGTLQRLPSIVGYGKAVELALSARRFSGSEAKELGLVSRVFGSKDAMDEGVQAIAEEIAAKSPLAVTGTKAVLLRSRDLTVNQGLDYIATWNSGMLLSDDLVEATAAQSQKRAPSFSKL
ncbi:hypothetical protein C3L33_13321, partial [Rhododendron williamsianum]